MVNAHVWCGLQYGLDRAASGFACVCLGLQLCAVLTSVQAAYTTLPVLFTDCGVMFLFGAFFQLVCMVLFMISMSVVAFERPRDLNDIPKDYTLDYSWSFYLGWGSFLFSLVTGIAYLLLSRAWETEEVWLKPMGKEKKGPKL
ncbi:hypothetical protein HOLleu_18716 [Holothuria leucospilota]|uniref:Uncharacterized protein n=1 Tax=Holothuria leucospilota TaxID=206669 RepID=A0A9Q1C3M7_HOLLE|nr:hypothetical protein HOLleu_18716 [Holothuria leucospilota]